MIVHAESAGIDVPTLLGTVEPAPSEGPLRWSRFLPATEAEGPGRRAALWVQGCRVHCPECFNPHLWATRGGVLSDPADIAAEWLEAARAAGSTGITLLGGEPFEQAAALGPIARVFRDADMSVMTFSGHTLPDLARWAEQRDDISALLEATDLLCDGPYLREHPDTSRPWIGSTNQGIRALSPAYADEVRRIASEGRADTIEVRIAADGLVRVNGWASDAALSALLEDLGVRADRPQEHVA